jgi:DNA-binding CsgD family transcriptional regulator
VLPMPRGAPPSPSLVSGCREATAGNPFAVSELIATLRLDGGDLADVTARLTQRVPGAIVRSIRARLSRLEPDAVSVARSLAVLGDGAPLHRVAALARLAGSRTSLMADQLAGAELVAATRPLAFVHPLVRSAIEDDMPLGARSELHAAAAERLAAENGDPEAIAAHLLRTDPVNEGMSVERLRAAAALALRRGAPDVAISYLRRAEAEPPQREDRVAVLHELGRAEVLARAPAGVEHLEHALAQAGDPVTRARIGLDLFDGMTFTGRWREALALVEGLRRELGDDDRALALGLEMRCALTVIEHNAGADSQELRRLETLARSEPGGRPLLLLVALALSLRGERCDEVAALVADGLQDGRFLAEHTADSVLAVHAIDALVFVDALGAAATLAESVCDDARRRGLVLGAVAGATHRGLAGLKAGQLAEAERDLRDALATASEHELHFTLPFVCAYLAESLFEQGRLDEAAAELALVPEAFLAFANAGAATLLWVRGAIRLAAGQPADAMSDLRACGERLADMGVANPVVAPWRSTLALALGPEAHDAADALIAEELVLARRAGVPRGVGTALLAQARLHPGTDAVAILEEAVAVVARSPGALDRAKILTELGTALRHAGRFAEARLQLREALDIASHCGAGGLAARITTELHITGARPRSPWLTGVGALTPSELRVARLAARGLTNHQIATELVITPKTVKHHLGAVYRKLAISTRSELDSEALTLTAEGLSSM